VGAAARTGAGTGARPPQGADLDDILARRGAALVDTLVQGVATSRRVALDRAIAKAAAKVERRIAAVEGDLARTEAADALAARARAFVAEAARAPRGAAKLTAVDWTTGEAVPIEMALDPSRDAQSQVDAMFKRARRLKEGAAIARTRLEQARAARDGLRQARAALAEPDADPDAVETGARTSAPHDFKLTAIAQAPSARARAEAPRPPYRAFAGASGARILVGRGAAHNDALTFHVGRPHDLWLHAKDRAGAHVVVPLDKGASCPPDLLVEAAHLAAHFSEARDEKVVDVQYTPRRYLRKPRGSAPGFVVVDREKVLVLRREDAILRRLLEGEQTPG
jgi:predicted ribosome quality control (RQC) complex YloA/Tae2 family protein